MLISKRLLQAAGIDQAIRFIGNDNTIEIWAEGNSEQTFLKANFVMRPQVVDMDRTRRGDYFKKPTGYFFINCEPENGFTHQKNHNAKPVLSFKGSDGKGTEALINFKSGSRLSGGIACNKWDENRVTPEPYTVKQRNTGMNYQMRRIENVMMMLAEADVALGETGEALTLINQLRSRAGVANISSATMEAVEQEVKREFVGEGDIRWAQIRMGVFTDRAKQVRADIKTMIAGLEKDGYYTFPNGRTISNYVWTKLVAAPACGMLTMDRVEGDPAQVPGWRGVYDYSKTSVASIVVGTEHNLAIKGLYEYIDPNGAEAAALEADGYTKQNWGIDIVAGKDQLWDYNILSGITLTDVPLYFHPIPATTISQSEGQVTNGYGLPQQ